MYYHSIEHQNLLTLYHFRIQIAIFGTHKTCYKPKSQKNVHVPANNCHLKMKQHTFYFKSPMTLIRSRKSHIVTFFVHSFYAAINSIESIARMATAGQLNKCFHWIRLKLHCFTFPAHIRIQAGFSVGDTLFPSYVIVNACAECST